MHRLDRIVDVVDWLAKLVGAVLAALMASVMLAQVSFRYVLNSSLPWSEELSVYFMIWGIFVGAAIVMRNWQHTSITVFANALPRSGRVVLLLLAKIGTMVFLLTLAVLGFQVFGADFHGHSIVMGFSTKWVKLSIPVGATLMIFFSGNSILRDVLAFRDGRFDHFDKKKNSSSSDFVTSQ